MSTDSEGSGDPGATLNDMLAAAIARVRADLAKGPCAKDFKNAKKQMAKLAKVGFHDHGIPMFDTGPNETTITDKDSSPTAQYNPFSENIRLNSSINWASSNNTAVTLDGKPYTYPAADAEASYVGASSVSPEQFMDISIFHELAHRGSAIGNPDNAAVEAKLWRDCIL